MTKYICEEDILNELFSSPKHIRWRCMCIITQGVNPFRILPWAKLFIPLGGVRLIPLGLSLIMKVLDDNIYHLLIIMFYIMTYYL